MRINKYIALATGLSRRAADKTLAEGRVRVNDKYPDAGYDVTDTDNVTLDGRKITPALKVTILLNKPVGYVVSRDGQGSETVYDLLPLEYEQLKPVGRLDKMSSGLLLMTNDGDLANELTHPSRQKIKIYEVTLSKPLEPLHHQMLVDFGVQLDDGVSKFKQLEKLNDLSTKWKVVMSEGRNRQIRRTFGALGYGVKRLHRSHFGPYELGHLGSGKYLKV